MSKSVRDRYKPRTFEYTINGDGTISATLSSPEVLEELKRAYDCMLNNRKRSQERFQAKRKGLWDKEKRIPEIQFKNTCDSSSGEDDVEAVELQDLSLLDDGNRSPPSDVDDDPVPQETDAEQIIEEPSAKPLLPSPPMTAVDRINRSKNRCRNKKTPDYSF